MMGAAQVVKGHASPNEWLLCGRLNTGEDDDDRGLAGTVRRDG